ncbi:major facilitator superfamily domain-containing protein [Fimicolochytrium jonesii]|uniref:major facilitator superfamily domain-containing protein n=1 Tax=Fimicolochytrium jonesii TaxID=1396493 RepID=UPI0022FEBC09|nr:major facilitator superfamily domain-containing protein [Fimicolochytrium jonesii]KAI8819940.1 major facilitator superfamily domain-containing protein [Fimicolochytrium jonesii]
MSSERGRSNATLPSITLRHPTQTSLNLNRNGEPHPPGSVTGYQPSRLSQVTASNTDSGDYDDSYEIENPHGQEDADNDDANPLLGTHLSRKGDGSPDSRPPSYATLVSPISLDSLDDDGNNNNNNCLHVSPREGSEYGGSQCSSRRSTSGKSKARKGIWKWVPRWKVPPKDTVVVLTALFATEASRGLVIPTMISYVQLLGGTVATLGALISLFSIGRLICSVPFGAWADKRQSSREVLIFASILAAASNLLYAFAWALPNPMWWLYASRLACGFSTGTIAVFRAYLASSVPPSERTKVIAWSGMAQYAGFSLTPIIATFVMLAKDAWFSTHPSSTSEEVPDPDPTTTGPTILDCVLPNAFLIFLNLLLIPLLLLCMPAKDPVAHTPPPRTPTPLPNPVTSQSTLAAEAQLVKSGFILFFLLNFVLRGVIGVTETLAPDMYQHHKHTDPQAAEHSGQFFFALGMVGMAVFLTVDPLQKRLLAGHNLLILGTTTVILGTLLNIDPEPARTPATWSLFVAGMTLIWSVGSPICQTLTVSMFSKMLGTRPQGSLIGWITTAGSLGRIVFPALVGTGDRAAVWVNWLDVALCCGCVVGVVVFERMVKRVRTCVGEGVADWEADDDRSESGSEASETDRLLLPNERDTDPLVDMDGETDTEN